LKLALEGGMPDVDASRKLAAWYREFAERAGDHWIWERRLRTAEQLKAERHRVEAIRVVFDRTKSRLE
jgi:hypothetical protein